MKPEIAEKIKRIEQKSRTRAKFNENNPIADWLMGNGYVMYYPALSLMLDSVNAAILLGKAWFWSNSPTAQERDGWFYWSQKDITEQTGLKKKATENARALLKERGILYSELRGSPPTVWFWLDKEEFFRQVGDYIDSSVDSTEDSSE